MTMFPFDLPAATALYVSLYVLTLAVHVVFMSYVLAGAGYVAVTTALGRARSDAAAGLLRDWLPFALGAAITAGVAPLLFVQILYRQGFYTANLLLFHRWMVVVPVLVIGFYLLYLGKSQVAERWGRAAGTAVTVAAFVCFAFTAYSWTENHLLALDHGAWAGFYAEGRMAYRSAGLAPRMMMWLSGAVPIMVIALGWQLVAARAKGTAGAGGSGSRGGDGPAGRLALMALLGMAAATVAAMVYVRTLGELELTAVRSVAARPYLLLIAGGMGAQAVAWLWQWRAGRLSTRLLMMASAGGGAAIVGTAAVREIVRMGTLSMGSLAGVHARAAEAGGFPVFCAFLVINTAVIVWCFRIARRGLREREAG